MSTTPFTCGGSKRSRPRIGVRLPVRSTTREHPLGGVLRHEIDYKAPACLSDDIVCARGSAKRAGSGLNGSLKSEGAAMESYCQPLGHSGVP